MMDKMNYKTNMMLFYNLMSMRQMSELSSEVKKAQEEQLSDLIGQLQEYHAVNKINPLSSDEINDLCAGVAAAVTVIHMLGESVTKAVLVREIAAPMASIITQLKALLTRLTDMKENVQQ